MICVLQIDDMTTTLRVKQTIRWYDNNPYALWWYLQRWSPIQMMECVSDPPEVKMKLSTNNVLNHMNTDKQYSDIE